MIPFLFKNWRVGLLVVGLGTTFATLAYLRIENEGLRAEVAEAESVATEARTAAKLERANATELARRLELAREEARQERAARAAAQEARDAALAESAERGDGLQETIIIEREADVTLDQCLARELPDSIVRQLPFRSGGAGPDRR